VSYVSTRNTQLFGIASAYPSNASSSSSKLITQLWAWVPRTGMPNSLPASTLLVASHPPTYAARLADSPPSTPCARRRPNSSTGSPRVAWQTRAALVAISVWKLTRFSSGVSMIWACRIGPVTRTSGSCGNTAVPSGTASTSSANSSFSR
jgi:hypothetical protein